MRTRRDEFGELGRGFTGMIRYMQEAARTANQIANGELTLNVAPKGDKDELGNAFAGVISRLRDSAAQVADALGVVSAVGERNLAAAQEMTGSIGKVARAMENVAAVAQENAASAEEVSATAEELSAQVEQVSGSAEELSALAEQLNQAIGGFRLNAARDEGDTPRAMERARGLSLRPSASGGAGHGDKERALTLLSA